jgi:hypothetical protein
VLSSSRSTSSGRVGVRRRLLPTSLMYAPPLRTTSAHGGASTTASANASRVLPALDAASAISLTSPRAESAMSEGHCDDHTPSRSAGPSEGRTGTPFAQIAGCLHSAQAADLNGPVVRLSFPGPVTVSPIDTPLARTRAS